MRRRRLPGRDLDFSELGFGGSGLGNLATEISDEQARGALEEAWSRGVRYVDTAPHYGLGLSERRLGAVLPQWPRDQFVVSTKVGRLLDPLSGPVAGSDPEGFAVPRTHRRVWDFSRDGVRRSLEASLNRLGLDRIDLVLVHDPDDHWEQASREAVPALVELREQGVIQAVGVGMNQSAMLARFVRETDVDVVMLAGRYTLLDHTALGDLLPVAQARGVGVIAAGVFNSGLLARDRPRKGAPFDYVPAAPRMLAKAALLGQICREYDTSLPAAAVNFVLAHPAVTCAVLGMRTEAQVRGNHDVYDRPPPPGLWKALRHRGLIPLDAPTP